MDVNTALQEVLKTALIHDGLAKGVRSVSRRWTSKCQSQLEHPIDMYFT